MKDVAIVSAVRTPVGKFLGALSDISAVDLGALVVREAVRRAGLPLEKIDECIMGCVLPAGLGQNLVETMLPSLSVPSMEAQAQTMMASALPSMEVPSLEAQAQTLMATALQGSGQQINGTPQPAVPGVPADFPVAQDAANLKVLATGDKAQINYQTKMSLIEVVSFCTAQLTSAGLQIRPDLLSLTETTVNLVFAKSSSPTDIVVQGVTTNGMTNVNVRYEVVK